MDGDLPTSSVQLPSGVVANPGGGSTTVLIGGSASDATSGVDRVEVRVNNGAWVEAVGAEAWSFPVPVVSGEYSIEVRAFDRAGNVSETVSGSLRVDGVGPVVTLDPFGGPVVNPATDGDGVRSLVLSGSVSDVVPSSGVARVEVQLTPSGVVPGAGGWQPAVVSGEVWSVDYRFSTDAREPVGEFDVRVRAVDVAGNVVEVSDVVVVDGAAPSAVVDDVDDVVGVGTVLRGDVFDIGAAGVGSVEVSLLSLSDVVNEVEPEWVSAAVDGSRWSSGVPDGVEDVIQVDVRSVDAVGNERVETNVWRGIVDTAVPRVSMSVTATGRVNARGSRSEFRVVCVVEDRFLDEGSFVCPGAKWREPIRTFAVSSELDSLFPDLVGVVGLRSEFTVWAAEPPSGVVSVCDLFGNCSESPAVAGVTGVAAVSAGPLVVGS
ncbi:MAG: OmpL47-type beta-barrel domain-containing protein, partial [Ilumatobacteraceae bacterium]